MHKDWVKRAEGRIMRKKRNWTVAFVTAVCALALLVAFFVVNAERLDVGLMRARELDFIVLFADDEGGCALLARNPDTKDVWSLNTSDLEDLAAEPGDMVRVRGESLVLGGELIDPPRIHGAESWEMLERGAFDPADVKAMEDYFVEQATAAKGESDAERLARETDELNNRHLSDDELNEVFDAMGGGTEEQRRQFIESVHELYEGDDGSATTDDEGGSL